MTEIDNTINILMTAGKYVIDDCDIIVTAGGSQHWFKSGTTGNYHRLDGPAYDNTAETGTKEYWIDGEKYSEEVYWKRIKMRSFW